MRWLKYITLIVLGLSLNYIELRFMVRAMPVGSYAYAETYEFDATEPQLIAAVENLKKSNPGYVVPPVFINGQRVNERMTDGRKDSSDYWYHMYVYYPVENQIVYFWIRSLEMGKTDIALVSVNNGLELGHWKDVNDKISRKENREIKGKFEERILDQLGYKYKDEGNGMKLGFIQF